MILDKVCSADYLVKHDGGIVAEKDEVKAAAGRKGALVRSQRLGNDRKREIGRNAALSRWSGSIPRAINEGILEIGEIQIECAVLEGGTRVINQESFLRAIGRSRSPKAGTGSASVEVDDLPPFLAADNLKPFITSELRQSTTPILYRPINEAPRAFGYNALLLPHVCDVYLRLKHEGKPTHMQEHVIRAAYTLMRALASAGILALVDKATGFDQEEEKREMLLIVQKYVAPELQPWLSKFPREFFRELRRLRGIPDTDTTKNPRYFGHLINKYIYEPLPPGVLDEVKRKNPANERGYRKHKNYQWFTGEIGIPHLDDQIKMVTMLMRVSETWEQYEVMFERAFAKQKRLPFKVASLLGPFHDEELPVD